jgi:hypothetical protein
MRKSPLFCGFILIFWIAFVFDIPTVYGQNGPQEDDPQEDADADRLEIISPEPNAVVKGTVPIVLKYGANWQGELVRVKYSFEDQTAKLALLSINLPNDVLESTESWETLDSSAQPKRQFPDGTYHLVIENSAGNELTSVDVILNNVPPQIAPIQSVLLHLGQSEFESVKRELKVEGVDARDTIIWDIDETDLGGIADVRRVGSELTITAQSAGKGSFTVIAINDTVKDPDNDRGELSVEVTVNTPPAIADKTALEGLLVIPSREQRRISLSALEVDDGDSITWSFVVSPPQSPVQITFSPISGEDTTATVSNTGTTEAPVRVTFRATDSRGGTDEVTASVFVHSPITQAQIHILSPKEGDVLSEASVNVSWVILETENQKIEEGDTVEVKLNSLDTERFRFTDDTIDAQEHTFIIDESVAEQPISDGGYILELDWFGQDEEQNEKLKSNSQIIFTIDAEPPALTKTTATRTIRLSQTGETVDLKAEFGITERVDVWTADVVKGGTYIELRTNQLQSGILTIQPRSADTPDPNNPTRLIGEAEIKITAAERPGGKAAEATLIVTTENHIPQIDEIERTQLIEAVRVLTQGEQKPVDISSLATDEDGDKITWRAEPRNPNVTVTFSSAGTQVTFAVSPNAAGTQPITLIARDSLGAEAKIDLMIQINQRPRPVEPQPSRIVTITEDNVEDEASRTRDLSAFIEDPDGDRLVWEVINRNTEIATADPVGASTFLFSGKPNQNGRTQFTFTATDPHDAKVELILTLNITPVNDPPEPKPGVEPRAILTIGGADLQLSINDYLIDPDESDRLSWTFENRDEVADFVEVRATRTAATVIATNPDATGSVPLRFLVSDGVIAEAERVEFTLTVEFNHPPVLTVQGQPLTLTFPEDRNPSPPYRLSDHITDEDGDLISFTVDVPGTAPFQETVSSDPDGALEFESKAENAFGPALVTVTADDGRGGVAEFQLQVTIEEVNDRPVILLFGDEIPPGKQPFPRADGIVVSQGETVTLNLPLFVVDPDNSDESQTNDDTLTWIADFPQLPDGVEVSLNGSRLTIVATPDAEPAEFVLSLTVSDGRGGEDFTSTNVKINTVPKLSLPARIPDPSLSADILTDLFGRPLEALEEDQPFRINLTSFVEDPDPNERLTWRVTATPNLFDSIEFEPKEFEPGTETHAIFTPTKDANGETTARFTVDDLGQATASGSIQITIQPSVDAPQLTLPRQVTFAEDDGSRDDDNPPWTVRIVETSEVQPNPNEQIISVSDDEQRPSQLTWEVTATPNLTAEVNGLTLSITPIDLDWHGEETLTIKVTDLDGLSDEGRLRVVVTPVAETPRFLIQTLTLSFPESADDDPQTGSRATQAWKDFVRDDETPLEELRIELVDQTGAPITDQEGNRIQVNLEGADNEGNRAIVFTVDNGDWHGEEDKWFKVTDGDGSSFDRRYTIKFTPTAEPPRLVKPFPPLEMTEDQSAPVELSGHFSDDETKETDFQWRVEPKVEHLSERVEGLLLTITPDKDWNTEVKNGGQPQTVTLVVTDTDEDAQEATTTFNVTIKAVDDALEFQDFTVEFKEDEEHLEDLSKHLTDPDLPEGAPLTAVTVEVDTPDPNLEIDPSDLSNVRFSAKQDWSGEATVVLKATKAGKENLSKIATVTINVTPEDDPPKVTLVRVEKDVDKFGTRVIKFNVSDPDAVEKKQDLKIRAFYRLSDQANEADEADEAKECLLYGATPDTVDGERFESVTREVTNKDQLLKLIWFSGVDELANALQETVIVEIEAIDETGEQAIGAQEGTPPQTEPFLLDNTDRVTPKLEKVEKLSLEETGTGTDESNTETRFKMTFQRELTEKPNVLVEYRVSGEEGVWKKAVVRGQGRQVNREGQLGGIARDGKPVEPFFKGKELTFFWNVAAFEATTGKKYDLQVTPIALNPAELPATLQQAWEEEPDVTTSFVGPSFVLESIDVDAPTTPSGVVVRLIPTSRIITPGRVDGYNDALDVLFLDEGATPDAKTEFSVYSLSGVQVYDATSANKTAEPLDNGWSKYSWNGQDSGGNVLPSGLYIYILKAGQIRKGTFVIAR